MKKLLHIFCGAIILMGLSCSDNDQFRVNGTIEGKPTMNLRVAYYSDGAFRTQITAAREGEFEFYGTARQPALIEVTDYEYRPLARLIAENGKTYKVKVDPTNRYRIDVSGGEINERWSKFLRENADSLELDANAIVARYVDEHRDDIVSTLLLLTVFDASHAIAEADSLMEMIAPEARPSSLTEGYNDVMQRLVTSVALGDVLPIKYIDQKDTIRSFNPAEQAYSIIMLSRDGDFRSDSIVPALKRLYKDYKKSRLAILDFSLDSDEASWKRSIRTDSAEWSQGWGAGGVASLGVDRLGIPRVPFVIVCDSTGRQLYRGSEIATAEKIVNTIVKEK
ncbi:MAG: hypothetical protein J1F05_08075 [Muribaculaceae bacterium]|nr:hypothetical protein [Muribaculaceae bacterium]